MGLEKIDVLEAKLRDAQEEIQSMRIQMVELGTPEVVFISLSSSIACANNQIVDWNVPIGDIPRKNFHHSEDHKQVQILKAGVYQIQVRLAGVNTANTSFMSLELNGKSFAQCTQSDANGHQNTPQITEFARLAVNDVLQVKCGTNSGSLNVALANRFSILYMGK